MPGPELIVTVDGEQLEAEWHRAEDATLTIVATHPHPLYGGDMNNTVPAALARTLPPRGINVLRFNFRGVGASTGLHGEGRAEVKDLAAAIAFAAEQDESPIVIAGYSFGADVALAEAYDNIVGWLAVAPPLRLFETFGASTDDRPKHLIVPAHDQFCPPDDAQVRTAGWTHTSITRIEGADHFITGRTDALIAAANEALAQLQH